MLVIGGGMANTFLAAQGTPVGKSLAEHDLAPTGARDHGQGARGRCTILLPVDIVVAQEFAAHAAHQVLPATACPADGMILDVGPETVARIDQALTGARTLIWNGPLGAFETPPFDQGTMAAARAAGALTLKGALTSVAGGGDTVAALNAAGVADDFTYISTAGGAFLEWMEGKDLPGVAALNHDGRGPSAPLDKPELPEFSFLPKYPGGPGAGPRGPGPGPDRERKTPMKTTRIVQNILRNYEGENPGVKTNLARMLMEGRLGGTGKMIILPVDQGFEHGPHRSFAVNPASFDPHYHYQMAVDAGLSAYAAPLARLRPGPTRSQARSRRS